MAKLGASVILISGISANKVRALPPPPVEIEQQLNILIDSTRRNLQATESVQSRLAELNRRVTQLNELVAIRGRELEERGREVEDLKLQLSEIQMSELENTKSSSSSSASEESGIVSNSNVSKSQKVKNYTRTLVTRHIKFIIDDVVSGIMRGILK